MITSAVFVVTVALQNKFHSPTNFRKILGTCQRRLDMFCRPGKLYDRVTREKLLGVLWKYSVDGCLLLAVD